MALASDALLIVHQTGLVFRATMATRQSRSGSEQTLQATSLNTVKASLYVMLVSVPCDPSEL